MKKQLFFFVLVLTCASQFVLCINDYNPYQDPSVANAVVISKLKTGDSLEMYSTQNLTIILTNPKLIKQVRLVANNNRYFRDTVVDDSLFDMSGPVQFDFKMSFYDTGWQEIRIFTLRNDGEEINEKVRFYSTQPLLQPFVRANSGEQFTLETRPVKDENVIYNWKLGDIKIESKTAKTVDTIKAHSDTGNGELWVCDIFGHNSSPHIAFGYSLFDTVPPVIKCINDIAIFNKDTIVTSDSVFRLLLNITDNGSSTIIATIDNLPFSRAENPLFVQSIEGVETFSQPESFRVRAFDGRNVAEKVIFIKYDSNAKKETNLPVITIITPHKDSIAASQKLYTVHGIIRKNYSSQDSVVLKIKLNNIIDIVEKRVKITEDDPLWSFDIQLALRVNLIEIQAFDTKGLLICFKKAVLVYDGDSEDKTAPQIVELSLDRIPVQSGESRKTVPNECSKLKIVAFDDGSGIKQVLVNEKEITSNVSADRYVWEDSICLSHEKYQPYKIEVVDRSNNKTRVAIDLRYNNLPQIRPEFDDTKTLIVGSTYSERLPVFDPNYDYLTFTKISERPATMLVGPADGVVTWTPTINDTGMSYVQINVSDNISDTIFNFTINVKKNDQSSFQLKTTERNFPSVIESDDTIKIPVLVDSLSGVSPFTFSATTADGRPVMFNGNQIKWHPDTADTGRVQLRVKVGEKGGDSVTLFPVIRVIPAIDKIKFVCSWTGDTTGNGSLDLKKYGSESDTLKVQIIDPYKQFRRYTAAATYGVESASLYTVDSSGRLNVIVGKKRKNSGIDSLIITVKDSFSHELIIKKQIDYGVLLNPVIVSPKTDTTISDSTVNLRWTRCGADSSVLYKIFLSRIDSSATSLIAQTYDTSMIVKLSKAGIYYAQVVAVKNDTTIRSAIKTFQVVLPEPIFITYVPATFRTFLTVGKDSMNLKLVVKNNLGPYTFTKTGLFADKFSIDNAGILTFKPTETRNCSLTVVVQDSAGGQDTLVTPKILVIPANRPCSLSVAPLISDSIIPISSKAVTYTFTIADPDSFVYEDHSVSVRLFTTETNVKVDSTGIFSVKIDPSQLTSGYDSLRVIVTDKGGFSDTISAKIKSDDSNGITYVSPADNDIVYDSSFPLTWSPYVSIGVETIYTLICDTNPSPSNVLASLKTTSYLFKTAIPGTVYYWRVVASVGTQIITGSVRRFITAPSIPIVGK